MSGLTSRRKGKAGESEATHLLQERGYNLVQTRCGAKEEDIVCLVDGSLTAVEVKNCRLWKLDDWRRQAKEQARRRKARWLLMVRVQGYPGTFYVEGSDRPPTVWRSNLARQIQ